MSKKAAYVQLLKASIDADNLDENERIFKAIGSVECFDKQNQKITIEALEKVMPIMIKRGGVLLRGHKNRPVGNIIDWERQDIPIMKDGKIVKKPAIVLTGRINKDFTIDHEAWEDIKRGYINGVSLGGRGIEKTTGCEDDVCGEVFNKIELWEFSLTDRKAPPANPYATIVEFNELAKAEMEDKNMDKEDEILAELKEIKAKVDKITDDEDGDEKVETPDVDGEDEIEDSAEPKDEKPTEPESSIDEPETEDDEADDLETETNDDEDEDVNDDEPEVDETEEPTDEEGEVEESTEDEPIDDIEPDEEIIEPPAEQPTEGDNSDESEQKMYAQIKNINAQLTQIRSLLSGRPGEGENMDVEEIESIKKNIDTLSDELNKILEKAHHEDAGMDGKVKKPSGDLNPGAEVGVNDEGGNAKGGVPEPRLRTDGKPGTDIKLPNDEDKKAKLMKNEKEEDENMGFSEEEVKDLISKAVKDALVEFQKAQTTVVEEPKVEAPPAPEEVDESNLVKGTPEQPDVGEAEIQSPIAPMATANQEDNEFLKIMDELEKNMKECAHIGQMTVGWDTIKQAEDRIRLRKEAQLQEILGMGIGGA